MFLPLSPHISLCVDRSRCLPTFKKQLAPNRPSRTAYSVFTHVAAPRLASTPGRVTQSVGAFQLHKAEVAGLFECLAGDSTVVTCVLWRSLEGSLTVWDGDWEPETSPVLGVSGGGFCTRAAYILTANTTARTALLTRPPTFLEAHVVPQPSVGCSKFLGVVCHWTDAESCLWERTASRKLGRSLVAALQRPLQGREVSRPAGHWPINRACFPGRKRTARGGEANTRTSILI